MCPMLLNRLSDGPAMVLSPPQEHAFVQFPSQQTLNSGSGSFQNYSSPFPNGVHAHIPKSGMNSFSSYKPALSSTPVTSTLSRKRSRDDASIDDGEQFGAASQAPAMSTTPSPIPKEEPIYGEGMVLLNPRTGLALSAESQTGTWYEEKAERAAAAAPAISSRSNATHPDFPSRKSQRLDTAAPGLDDIALASIHQRLQGSFADSNRRSHPSTGSGSLSPEEPLVDDATHLLGISWQRIRLDDNDIAAAVRGWKKYIDNQYSSHLQDSQILMKNRALNAYLVAARPITPAAFASSASFYLFSEDLAQAQLVGSSWDICLRNLRSNPIVFEGTQVLRAADKALDQPSHSMNGFASPNAAAAGVPLLQAMSTQSFGNVGNVGLNEGVGMGTGMDIDS